MRRALSVIFIVLYLFSAGQVLGDDLIEREYYINGRLKIEIQLNKKGEKHGYETLYYETGELWSKTVFLKGKKNEIEKVYYKSGQVMCLRPYDRGRLDGVKKGYWRNGKIMERITYKRGIQDGLTQYFDMKGNLTEEEIWEESNLIETKIID